MTIQLLAFAGSTRTGSFNKLLVQNAVQVAKDKGAAVTYIDLRDYPMALYDGDLEKNSGVPDHAKTLTHLMIDHHGIILGCPEYNSAITAVLKNTIDWMSRPQEGVASLAAFSGKTAALFAASPGALGGLRTLATVRSILSNLGMIVIPKQFGLGKAPDSFDGEGKLINHSASGNVSVVIDQLIDVTARLNPDPRQETSI